MKEMILKTCFYTALIFSLAISSTYASTVVDTITGGRLYDEWWVNTDLTKPSGTHPAYPANGKKKGAATWRCKECGASGYESVY
jgi:thiosulfate dehydrogenase